MRLAESGGGKRETLKLKPEVADPANYAGARQDTREAGMAKKPYIIALEEHYQDPEVKQFGGGPGAGRDIVERLDDLGALRIREMDEAGIDLQVLSHSIPGLQAVDAEARPPLARRTNDRLHEAVQRHPDRFSAFAVLPIAHPRAAAALPSVIGGPANHVPLTTKAPLRLQPGGRRFVMFLPSSRRSPLSPK